MRIFVLCALAGCGESLFDSHDNGSNGPDSAVPLACEAPCLGDAAGDFDGTANGSTGRWQYLEDSRHRAWAAMSTSASGAVGTVDPLNKIATCDGQGGATCGDLPHALLISSAGSASAADPSIAFRVADSKVIQLTLRVLAPAGSDQVVRLYRNSREDSLFTGTAAGGAILQTSISVDALAGDRILLALAPTGAGASDVAVHLFVHDARQSFPQSCLFAATFDAAAGNGVDNLCGGALAHDDDASSMDSPPVLGASPFPELGMAADLAAGTYYKASDVLVKTGDSTTQLWVRQRLEESEAAYPFSDLDLDSGGGLAIDLYDDGGTLKLEVATCTSPEPLAIANVLAPYPNDHEWHFVRVSHAAGKVSVCIDGAQVSSMPVPSGGLKSGFTPYIGKDVVWTPSGSYMNGFVDDVRVFNVALPCE